MLVNFTKTFNYYDKTKRFTIRYNEGIVDIPAKNVEDAINQFKKLPFVSTIKEFTVVTQQELTKELRINFNKQ